MRKLIAAGLVAVSLLVAAPAAAAPRYENCIKVKVDGRVWRLCLGDHGTFPQPKGWPTPPPTW